MTKNDLIKILISNYNDINPSQIENMVKHIFNLMAQSLEYGDRIEIRGFGSFSIRQWNPRITRNPKTGEKVRKGHTRAIHFKPGKDLKLRVNIKKD